MTGPIEVGVASASGVNAIASDPFVTAVCCVFVMFYAFKRYDTPETNRRSTTRSLFLITGAGYVLVTLIFYFVLCRIILKPGVLYFLGPSIEDAQKLVSQYSAPPILAAVALTTLLPNIRVVKDWDAWVLRRFQKWGSIPFGVSNLAEDVLRCEPPTARELAELREWMADDGDVPNELICRASGDATNTARGSLTQVLRLMRSAERLAASPGFARVVRRCKLDPQKQKEEFRVYAAISQAFFVLFDHLQALEGPAGEDAKKQAREHYTEISRKQSLSIATFIAQLLLASESSELQIARRLASVGLPVREHGALPLPVGPLVFVGAVIVALVLSVASFMPRQPAPAGALPYAMVAVLIGITKTIGALAAVLPKLRWRSARVGDDGSLPYLSWLGWAALATILGLIIERLTLAALIPPFSTAFDFQTYPLTPIAPSTFVICVAIAILCDVNIPLGREWVRRLIEGALCGAAMVVALIVCFSQLEMATAISTHISPWIHFGFPFSIGFFWGAVAPHLYRTHLRQMESSRQVLTSALGQAG